MPWFVKFLFWPWFFGGTQKLILRLSQLSALKVLVLLLFLFVALLFVRIVTVKARIKSGDWPKFLQVAARIFITFLAIGIAGEASIPVAAYSNGNKMPVAFHDDGDLKMVVDGMDRYHSLANEDTKYFWLTDYIHIQSSKMLTFLFPSNDHVAPGDLAIAVSIIFLWWTALTIVIWSAYHIARRILKI